MKYSEGFFCIVTRGDKGDEIRTCTKDEVIPYIAEVGRQVGDPRKIQRIFSVGLRGQVVFYDVIFHGVLQLSAQPNAEGGYERGR